MFHSDDFCNINDIISYNLNWTCYLQLQKQFSHIAEAWGIGLPTFVSWENLKNQRMSNDANYAVPEEGIQTNIKRKDVSSSFFYLDEKSISPFTSPHTLILNLVLVVFVYFVQDVILSFDYWVFDEYFH